MPTWFAVAAGPQPPRLELSRGPGAGRLALVTQQVVCSLSWNPDRRTLCPGLIPLLIIPRKRQAVLGNMALPFSEGRLRQSPWLCCGRVEMEPRYSDLECACALSPLSHPEVAWPTASCAFCDSEHLPLDPGPSLGDGRDAHSFMHVTTPWLFGGRDPVSLTPVCHPNLFLMPAGSVSSRSNSSVFSPSCRIRASVLQTHSLLWSAHKSKRPLPYLPLLTLLLSVLAFPSG